MEISRRAIAALGTGLLNLLALNGCFAARAVETGSEVKGVSLVVASDLPRSPEGGSVDDYCEHYRATDLTTTGRAVAERGWIVTSEAPLGQYRVVTFASGFNPGTSGVCTARNGNIGVFDGTRLVALAYSPSGSDTILGAVESMENGALLVWGGDYPAPPLGELHLDQDHPRLTGVAPARSFCRRTATVPNVYGRSIDAARTDLIAHGWRPLPSTGNEGEYSGAERLTRRGVIEAEACSGTGMGYCALKYQGAGGVLNVTTAGDDDRIVSYGVTCSGH